MTETDALMALNAVPGMGCVSTRKLVHYAGEAASIFQLDEQAWANVDFLSTEQIKQIRAMDVAKFIAEEHKHLQRLKARVITYFDDDYPERLQHLYDPPIVLYVMGEWPSDMDMTLAIVGSRRCSFYGRATAERFAGQLTEQGFSIISGMARGIDTAAHQGCLKAKGKTVAVLGCGLNIVYPPENRVLRDHIAVSGVVVTEFPCTMPPLPINFPRRNRIVSMLSMGVVVIEAAYKSGALITAHLALDQGKEVFAVPGNVDSPMSTGTLDLIKQGATLVTEARDIIQTLPVGELLNESESEEAPILSENEQNVYEVLKKQAQHVDQIAKMCDTSDALLKATLLQLEFKGLVRQEPGMMFKLTGD